MENAHILDVFKYFIKLNSNPQLGVEFPFTMKKIKCV